MWDLTPIIVSYKPPILYVGYSSSQYGTGVLQPKNPEEPKT
jgi:hypothetical protein